jgi:hypothetical protein
MKHVLKSLFVSSLFVAACGGSPAPAPMAPAPGPAPAAADNGQPRMQAALDSLQKAQGETTAADDNKGGHRAKALESIGHAIESVNAGIAYAAAHANESGAEEGPATADPVDEEVKGAGGQPHMAAAVVALREARDQLHHAKHDKGGNREKAIEEINHALKQLHEGIRYADEHHGE